MNKQEFIQAVIELKYSGYGTAKYDREFGFNDCRQEVMELAGKLDECGLTFEGYSYLREQTNELVKVYKELASVNNELFNSYKQNRDLMKENESIKKNIKRNIERNCEFQIRNFTARLLGDLRTVEPTSNTEERMEKIVKDYIERAFREEQ